MCHKDKTALTPTIDLPLDHRLFRLTTGTKLFAIDLSCKIRISMTSERPLPPYLRTALIAFCAGAVASIVAGLMTSGLAASYAFVAMWTWGILARLGGEPLADDRLVLMTVVAAIHGMIFSVIVTLGRLAFPKLREPEWGGNVLLLATVVYGVLLAIAFPLRP